MPETEWIEKFVIKVGSSLVLIIPADITKLYRIKERSRVKFKVKL